MALVTVSDRCRALVALDNEKHALYCQAEMLATTQRLMLTTVFDLITDLGKQHEAIIHKLGS